MRGAAAVCVLAAAIAGCGGGSSGGGSKTATVSRETTRTEVVRAIAQSRGSFNPEAIYKALSPGVVTIVSLSGSGTVNAPRRGSLGSGFVVDRDGYVVGVLSEVDCLSHPGGAETPVDDAMSAPARTIAVTASVIARRPSVACSTRCRRRGTREAR